MATIDSDFIRAEKMSVAREDADALFFIIIAIATCASALDDSVSPGQQGRMVVVERVGSQTKFGGTLGVVKHFSCVQHGT